MDENKLKDQIKEEILEELKKEEEGELFVNTAKTPGEKFVKGFDYAFEGLVYAISNEKNMKFHVLVSVLVLLASLFFNVSRVEMIFLILSISFVICMELVNTAIEEAVNLASKGKVSKLAKAAKDVSAAATFVSALVSIFVAYLIFFDKLTNFSNSLFIRISRRPSHLALITVAVVIILTIFLKGLFYKGKGTAFHGGFVSGHTAVSFALATIGAMMTSGDSFSILIFYGLAIIVAESRFEADIHSLPEIIRGAILGSLLAFSIFGAFS
ncbi:MAG: diacylglycerol kinase [Anaerococcus sp.]|jgi:diacylglycerol kinase (ATP)|nr:diacylglycerol kinase [Peptoniphilaceae bacterium]MDY3054438.1 diacylglycerol kinase [Anaerococcus sp.]